MNRTFHVFSVDLGLIVCNMSHCLSFLYTSLFSQLIFLLSIYIIALVCFLIVDIRSTWLPLIKPTSTNKVCMHVTIIIIAFHFKRLQNSEYQNILIAVAEKQPVNQQCVLLCGWNNLIYTTSDDNVRLVILLILIGFHKLYCISLQKTPKQWVSECAHHSCQATTGILPYYIVETAWSILLIMTLWKRYKNNQHLYTSKSYFLNYTKMGSNSNNEFFFSKEDTVTNLATWFVLHAVRIFLSLPTPR